MSVFPRDMHQEPHIVRLTLLRGQIKFERLGCLQFCIEKVSLLDKLIRGFCPKDSTRHQQRRHQRKRLAENRIHAFTSRRPEAERPRPLVPVTVARVFVSATRKCALAYAKSALTFMARERISRIRFCGSRSSLRPQPSDPHLGVLLRLTAVQLAAGC